MLNPKAIQELKSKLLSQKEEILKSQGLLEDSRRQISERNIEIEESASIESASMRMEALDMHAKLELSKINTALLNMERGEYGICLACEEPISIKRLQAVPWAQHCIDCASEFESKPNILLKFNLSKEQDSDSDTQNVREDILEKVYSDDRIDFDEDQVEILYENGVVILKGQLEDERSHQTLLEIIEDDLGYDDIIDHIAIKTKKTSTKPASSSQSSIEKENQGDDFEVDSFESMQSGEPMTPPEKFIDNQ